MQRITLETKISYVITEKELKEIRVKERKKVLDEVIKIARAEIDFESQAEQKRFVEFMEEMKKEEIDVKVH